ncbi:MAG: D-glycero-beta-D-manno-heptose-7-phosphate kinase [Proteobacteria bacterium]|nr:D-glycero-beta-D-manno-heptose-7-phosphate kinase [Pseudomonadota bacterium]MBI3500084.1 D-glycero-beta-D-manno-heptose-7-phosphate kinase [Pseudomonadota bacterium]
MTERSELAAKVPLLSNARLLCIGDVMLDRFVRGRVDRVSPEAPIPILVVDVEEAMLGGAGNVVRNLASLGASCCFVSVVGDDPAGREVTEMVGREPTVEAHLLVEPRRRTTIKMRYVAQGQQLLRADRESVLAPGAMVEADLIHRAEEDIAFSQAVLLSDYAKGVLTDQVVQRLIQAARKQNRPVVVDPKGRDFRRYRGATVLTPNRRELAEATGMPIGDSESIEKAARRLIAEAGVAAVLVTRSEDGMSLVSAEEAHHLTSEAREVADVSGAGDTVLAVFGAALAAGLTMLDAARLANLGAGVVVGKRGTATLSLNEMVAALHTEELHAAEAKSLSLDQALERIRGWRHQGFKIGFTNGCFDLLHPGHLALIAQARTQCDRLVVGLNSDASVARLKGPGRPVQSEASRAAILGEMEKVDLVVGFAEDTPLKLIEAIRPDVLVKGADYTVDNVVGADVVQSYGGKVLLAELAPGHSTTETIKRLAKSA